VSSSQLPPSSHAFISRYIRSVEQLEILLLFGREPTARLSAAQVYDAILSTPQSVERWLDELARAGLLEKVTEPAGFRCCSDEKLLPEIAALANLYRTKPVRVIETIYKRESSAAQSFADAFKIKKPDHDP
jgi:Fe2+ or Zn2+ uptake regulation protein